jgi:hypothetical protein
MESIKVSRLTYVVGYIPGSRVSPLAYQCCLVRIHSMDRQSMGPKVMVFFFFFFF